MQISKITFFQKIHYHFKMDQNKMKRNYKILKTSLINYFELNSENSEINYFDYFLENFIKKQINEMEIIDSIKKNPLNELIKFKKIFQKIRKKKKILDYGNNIKRNYIIYN